MKRVLSLLLVAAMLLAIPVMPIGAKAATNEVNITDPTSQCPCCGVPMNELTWIPFDASVGSTPPAGHYYLAEDYNQTSIKYVMAWDHVVLDLRGHKWSSYTTTTLPSNTSYRLMTIQGYFYLMDTVGNGVVEAQMKPNYGGAFLLDVNEHEQPEFHFLSGTIRPRAGEEAATHGGFLYAYESGIFKMSGGCIENFVATTGNGGAILGSKDSQILISGGTFKNCKAKTYGGAISTPGKLEVKNATFLNCTATSVGGAVHTSGKATIENCDFISCTGYSGGAIYADKELTLKSGTVMNCTATYRGGSVYLKTGPHTIENTRFIGGTATNWGGNIFQEGGSLTATNVSLEHGVANCKDNLYNGGGNYFAMSSAVATFDGGVFRDGYSANHGGNIFVSGSTLTLKNTQVYGGVSYKTADNIRSYNSTVTLDGANIEGDMVFEKNTLTLKNATKIGLKNTGVALTGTGTKIEASDLTEGAEIYVQYSPTDESTSTTAVAAGANMAYFKGAYRTTLSGGGADPITATNVDSGVIGGYCPHCNTQVAWTAYTSNSMKASGHYYLSTAASGYLNPKDADGNNMDIVLDLNGKTLTGGGRAFTNQSTLSIMDSGAGVWASATQWTGGKVTGYGFKDGNGGVIHNNKNLNIYGGTFVYLKKDGVNAERGGVVYLYSGTMNMYGGVLDGSAYDNVTATGWVSGATAPEGVGGAFYQNDGSTFTMRAGRMIGGTAYAGGTAGFGQNVTTTITGGSFHGGTATATASYTGGNLFFPGADEAKGTVSVSNVSITDGTSASAGGNVAFGRYYTTTFDNCFIADGTTTGNGGNLAMITAGLATVKNSYILGGTAFAGGNVALNGTSANITLDTCRVIGGKTTGGAGSNGGNLIASVGNAIIKGGELIYGVAGNNDGGVGGNICCSEAGKVTVQKNTAGQATKILNGYAKFGGNITVYKGNVILNAAVIGGGNAISIGKDIQISGDAAALTVGSDVTGKISVWPKEGAEITYGATLGGTTSTGLSSDLHLVVESLSTKPLITAKDGALAVSGVQVVDAQGNAQWCADFATAEAEVADGGYVKLFADTALNMTRDTFVDLNGKTVTVSGSGKLLGMDSTGDSYELPTGKVTFQGTSPVADKTLVSAPNGNKYVALVEDGAVSFHRLGADLTKVTVNIDKNGVYFKGVFGADEKLKGLVDTYGIAVSLQGMPDATFTDALKSEFKGADMANGETASGVIITNILKDSLEASVNAERGEKKIYASTYVKLNDGTTVFMGDDANTGEDDVAWCLKDALVRLDQLIDEDPTNFRKYTNDMREYYNKWQDSIGSWLESDSNFLTPEKDDVIDILMIGSSFCTYYVQEMWQIAEAAGLKVRVCNVYYSGCPLSKYYTDWKNGDAAYQFYETTGPERKSFAGSKSLEWCLAQGDWDVISMQEYTGNIRNDTAEAHLEKTDLYTDTLFPYITSQFPDAKFYFHQTWSFQKGYDRNGYTVTTAAKQAEDTYNQQQFALGLLRKYGDPATSGVAGSEFQVMDGRVPTGEAWQLVRDGWGGYAPYDDLCKRTGTTDNLGDYYHDGDLGGGQYLNALVWILQVMKDRGVNLTKEDIKWQPDNTTYGAKLAEDLNFQQLIDCAFEAVFGNGWTYNAANYQ